MTNLKIITLIILLIIFFSFIHIHMDQFYPSNTFETLDTLGTIDSIHDPLSLYKLEYSFKIVDRFNINHNCRGIIVTERSFFTIINDNFVNKFRSFLRGN